MNKNEVYKSLKSMKIVDFFGHKSGTAIYADGLCVHKDYMKHGLSNRYAI
jgi:hypothetical protein